SEALLIRVQGAETCIGVCFGGVELLLGDFPLFHQRGVALQIGLGELRVGAAAIDVGLGKGEVRGLRLFVGSLRAKEIGLRAGELRIRAGLATGDIFAGARNIHARGTSFAFRQSQGALGLIDGGLIIRRLNLGEHLAGLYGLVVLDKNFADAAGNLGRDGGDVAV